MSLQISGWELSLTSKFHIRYVSCDVVQEKVYITSSEWSSKSISYAECYAGFWWQSNFICGYHNNLSLSPFTRKNIFYIFYDWEPQDIVLVSSNFATTFKTVRIYEFYLTQCLEISGLVSLGSVSYGLLEACGWSGLSWA